MFIVYHNINKPGIWNKKVMRVFDLKQRFLGNKETQVDKLWIKKEIKI